MIGDIIRHERKKQGINQKDLAEKAGISNSYLTDIEKGRHTPSIKTLLKISEALQIDCGVILNTNKTNSD